MQILHFTLLKACFIHGLTPNARLDVTDVSACLIRRSRRNAVYLIVKVSAGATTATRQ